MSIVGIQRCSDYNEEKVYRTVLEIAEKTDFPDCRGKRILVKPNILSDAKVEDGITTHPSVVKAVVRLCQERGAKEVLVGDSPGLTGTHFRPSNCGISEVCDETGAVWADFCVDPVTKKLAGGDRVHVAKVLDEVDFTISCAKFKTHQLMYATGAVKNVFGLMPGLNKSPMHLRHPGRNDFASFIVDLFGISRVTYAFIDGVIGMEGPGPANGTLRPVGLIMGSSDAFALDRSQATIMGYDWKDMPILAEGEKRGLVGVPEYSILKAEELIIEDFKRLEVEKKKGFFSSLILPYFTRPLEKRRIKKRPHPLFDNDRCIHCQKCVRICPAKALTHDGKIAIDTDKCIRCYCCAEVCPADAITVKEK